MRRQKGGAAVVLGALSPRTRNAQVAMYQAGEVEHLVATDAIGMGLNMDVAHVAFAGSAKFDGTEHRRLRPPEMAQIAGRAGRHMSNGTFGATNGCEPFEPREVEAIESHTFPPLKALRWRNSELDFAQRRDAAGQPGPARRPRTACVKVRDADRPPQPRVPGAARGDPGAPRRAGAGPAAVAGLPDSRISARR